MISDKKARVVILQRGIPHYRLSFFETLRKMAIPKGIRLDVVHGSGGPIEQVEGNVADLAWAQIVPNRVLSLGGRELCCWQPAFRYLKGADLVISEQASRLLHNYPIQFLRHLGKFKFAFWGHGKNFQAGNEWRRYRALDRLAERVKTSQTRYADWWFAYTKLSRDAFIAAGAAPERITIVENSVETDLLALALKELDPETLARARIEAGITSKHVAVFCGALHSRKRLDFLLDACERVRHRAADFQLLVIGAGPEEHKIQTMAQQCNWLRYVGPRFGAERVPFMRLGRVMLLPAHVGLAVVDSFVLELPVVSTSLPGHSPEIAYLKNGENSVITAPTVDSYANGVLELLMDDEALARLQEGCREAAAQYTVANMASNFLNGIEACLSRAQ